MEKNIKDYLHLYLGCYAMHGGNRVCVCGLNVNSVHIQNILNMDTIPVDEIKPILRHLSDMTEEERKEYATLRYKYEYQPHPDITTMAYKIDYLLKKHFDLFGLIESGLAIDKTKSLING